MLFLVVLKYNVSLCLIIRNCWKLDGEWQEATQKNILSFKDGRQHSRYKVLTSVNLDHLIVQFVFVLLSTTNDSWLLIEQTETMVENDSYLGIATTQIIAIFYKRKMWNFKITSWCQSIFLYCRGQFRLAQGKLSASKIAIDKFHEWFGINVYYIFRTVVLTFYRAWHKNYEAMTVYRHFYSYGIISSIMNFIG